MCAGLPSSLQQTGRTDSEQVGRVTARRSKTQCSAMELAKHNGPIESESRHFALSAAQIQELGLDPREWLVGYVWVSK